MRTPRPDLTRADQLLPGDEWRENGRWLTLIERCAAPLPNQVRLRVRWSNGLGQTLDLFATDRRLLLRPDKAQ
jgi:hypothetical protein